MRKGEALGQRELDSVCLFIIFMTDCYERPDSIVWVYSIAYNHDRHLSALVTVNVSRGLCEYRGWKCKRHKPYRSTPNVHVYQNSI